MELPVLVAVVADHAEAQPQSTSTLLVGPPLFACPPLGMKTLVVHELPRQPSLLQWEALK